MFSYRDQGNTMAEYALISGVLTLAVIGGLITLGGGIKDSFDGFTAGLDKREKTQSGIVTSYNHNSSNLPGSEHNIVVHNPNTTKPVLEVLNHQQDRVTVAGIDGTQKNSLGSLMLANTFENLANKETDPESAAYIKKLAEISYYLGAAEGNVDGVTELTVPKTGTVSYNPANAISDIYSYNAKMKALLANPPATLDDQTKQQLTPLTNEVTQISKSYLDHYKSIIKNGKVNSFVPLKALKGDGKPGSSLDKKIGFHWYLGTLYKHQKSYSDLVSYQEVKTKAAKVLADSNVESVKVETTLTDAQKTDQLADRLEQLKRKEN